MFQALLSLLVHHWLIVLLFLVVFIPFCDYTLGVKPPRWLLYWTVVLATGFLIGGWIFLTAKPITATELQSAAPSQEPIPYQTAEGGEPTEPGPEESYEPAETPKSTTPPVSTCAKRWGAENC